MRLLLASDGSPGAEAAVQFGGMLARQLEAETLLVGSTAVPGEQLTVEGPPVEGVVRLAEQRKVDLLVIGGMRQPGPLARPAKVYDFIREANCAVLLVGEPRQQLRKILVCTAGGYKGRRAVRFTARLAAPAGASVELFHVMAEPPHLFEELEDDEVLSENSGLARSMRRQRRLLDAAGVAHQVRLRYGNVVDEVVDEVQEGDFDLVVTGTHPTGGGLLANWMMGDMTKAIVETVDRPILIVRTAGRAENWLGQLARRVLPRGWVRK